MGKKNKSFNHHHIIPKSRISEGLKVHKERNIIKMRKNVHQALHLICSNQTPQEQLQTWLKLHEGILTKEAREALEKLIGMRKEEFYHPELIK